MNQFSRDFQRCFAQGLHFYKKAQCKWKTTLHLLSKKKKNIYTIPVYFQPENIRSLCQAVPKNLGLVDTDVHCESINICTMYLLLLNKCAEYHQMLNGKIEFDDERVEGFSEI